MKSARFKKLSQGLKQVSLQHTAINYTVSIVEPALTECSLELWKFELLTPIYPTVNVMELLKDFQKSILLPSETLGKKSGQIFVSMNRKACLKVISEGDVRKMEEILERYISFKKECCSLVDVYAVIILRSNHLGYKSVDYYMMMPNLRGPNEDGTVLYDLKGHLDTRAVEARDFKDFSFGKDANFVKSQHLQRMVMLPLADRQRFLQQICRNLMFLESLGVIDYSLLLAFDSQSDWGGFKHFPLGGSLRVRWVIIDFCQQFNDLKKFQSAFKSIFHKDVSSVDPLTYSKRLLEFMTNLLKV